MIYKNLSKNKILIVTVVIFSFTIQFVFGQSFTDVSINHWAHNHINKLSQNNIIGGFPNATFKPNDSVSKVQMIVMIYNLVNRFDNVENIDRVVERQKYILDALRVDVYAPWAKNALAYALDAEIINYEELNRFFSQGTQTNATREEVSIYLSRALNKGKEYSKVIALPYIDTELIRASNVKYIDFLLNKGILNSNGDGYGRFNPNNTISRAEIASMLSKSFDYLVDNSHKNNLNNGINSDNRNVITEKKLTMKSGVIEFIDNNSILIKFDGNETKLFQRNTDVEIFVNGKKSIFNQLPLKQQANVTFTDEYKLVKIETTTSFIPDIEGIFNAVTPNVGFDLVVLRNGATNNTQTLKAYHRTKVQLDGANVSLNQLKSGDMIKLKVSGQDIDEIVATSKIKTYQGILQKRVESLQKPLITLNISGESITIEAKPDVRVRRNGGSNLVTNLKVGDVITLSTEYEKAVNIQATSVITRNVGRIEAINILKDSSSITILNDNKSETYNIDSSVYVKVNNIEKDLYDLRLDQIIEIVLENDEIIAIESRDDLNRTQINGTVSSIDIGSKYFVLEYLDRSTNKIVFKTVYYTNNTRITSSLAQVPISIYTLRVADQVFVIGDEKFNKFTADRVLLID
ncbi:S-layer homology domain-containing protein [Serpentinicella alkaliphila]|uniref:S-layer family protein n=1 Tax=Serpentinicella alkaliphila TaxID=1734049 RepID=A0A4R2TM38_9FIRM|nr:S-layer homology domain-containing protein [Serpentinicella alkaliphila]QUH25053.1 S-layer homology domain-containing protein [Serpentinicella alkaliphila]TCP98418.1 S-layer family protein [Serpentinicella alkaliphila]